MKRIECNEEIFTNSNNLSYYLLGAYVTDGCLATLNSKNKVKRVSITSKDIDWVESIRDIVSPKNKIIKRNIGNVFEFVFTNSKIYDWLIFHGCTPKKSLNLEIKNIPKIYYPDFIRGAIDGDGCILCYETKREKERKVFSINIATASLKFAEQIICILNEMNTKPHKKTVITKPKLFKGRLINGSLIYYVEVFHHDTVKIINKIYYKNDLLCLQRKFLKSKIILKIHEEQEKNKLEKRLNGKYGNKWPKNDELINMVQNLGYSEVQKKLNIGKETIRRKLKNILKDDFNNLIVFDKRKIRSINK